MLFPVSFVQLISTGEVWPITGADGALYIANGQTVTLAPGDEKHYSSVLIDAGGILEVSAGSTPVLIGSATSIINNGTIRGLLGEHTGGTFAKTFDTIEYSHTITQNNGGVGSQATWGGGTSTCPGGAQSNGNGGGGAGGANIEGMDASTCLTGDSASSTKGGDGGDDLNEGGVGANIYSGNGTNGSSRDVGAGNSTLGGGGGGSRGKHGQCVVLYAKDVSGTGNIYTYGQNGGNGGSGFNDGGGYSGGGGAGAAGGSGGNIFIRYRDSYADTFTLDYTGGAAGAPGANGVAGTAAQAGTVGALSATQLT